MVSHLPGLFHQSIMWRRDAAAANNSCGCCAKRHCQRTWWCLDRSCRHHAWRSDRWHTATAMISVLYLLTVTPKLTWPVWYKPTIRIASCSTALLLPCTMPLVQKDGHCIVLMHIPHMDMYYYYAVFNTPRVGHKEDESPNVEKKGSA